MADMDYSACRVSIYSVDCILKYPGSSWQRSYSDKIKYGKWLPWVLAVLPKLCPMIFYKCGLPKRVTLK